MTAKQNVSLVLLKYLHALNPFFNTIHYYIVGHSVKKRVQAKWEDEATIISNENRHYLQRLAQQRRDNRQRRYCQEERIHLIKVCTLSGPTLKARGWDLFQMYTGAVLFKPRSVCATGQRVKRMAQLQWFTVFLNDRWFYIMICFTEYSETNSLDWTYTTPARVRVQAL